ncbi:hypothetical protein EMEDMD4_790231 [Sinorhizobium medicae]|uniref:Uncharacterized protein n=1 Tax=Sinorhizobium medicae TaxID=110321 RepID=A0A508X5V5_9HYPH|nr:hypothetical protein EMEDMD4_790231 [Sinorhizobium medicae]
MNVAERSRFPRNNGLQIDAILRLATLVAKAVAGENLFAFTLISAPLPQKFGASGKRGALPSLCAV